MGLFGEDAALAACCRLIRFVLTAAFTLPVSPHELVRKFDGDFLKTPKLFRLLLLVIFYQAQLWFYPAGRAALTGLRGAVHQIHIVFIVFLVFIMDKQFRCLVGKTKLV